ncbi:MAG: ABC transporter transmembrane domain-containing protein, partial [Pseudomonadota bacterium]
MTAETRDYAVFEADLTGRSLSAKLLRRLVSWLKPYRGRLIISAGLVLMSSFAAVLMPVVMTRVIIDGLLYEHEAAINLPDFGMTSVTQWLHEGSNLSMLISACLLYAALAIFMTTCAHFHRMTLASAVLSGLRDLRRDLFAHLERKPSMFYDHVAVGRVMTRVTNDIENLYEMLSGFGMVVGEFVPFFVALFLMLSIDVELTLILLLVIPIVATVTYLLRIRRKISRIAIR